jgi:hypothetical protein
MSDQELRSAFEWDGDAGAPAAAGVAAPRRRRLPAALAAGAACAVAAGALAGALLPSGGSSGARAVLVDAARTTAQAGGYRFGVSASITANGRTVVLAGGGQVNEHPRSGTVELSGEGTTLSERLLPPYIYVQSSDTGGLWLRARIPPLPTSSMSRIDPQQVLGELRSAASISDSGQQTVGGVATTHYHCTIDLARLIAADPALQGSATAAALTKLAGEVVGGAIPIDLWVDAQHRVRELSESLSIQAAGQSVSVSMTMQLFDYGSQPAVSAPLAAQVRDVGSPPTFSG